MVKLIDNIEVGKKIKIARKNKEEESFSSQILDIVGENYIISGPFKKNKLIFIHKDEIIKLYYTIKDKGIFTYTAKVISIKLSPIYTLTVKKVSNMIKIQNREHFSLLFGLSVEKEYELYLNGKKETHKEKCEAKDIYISGGGMRVYCNFKHKLNDKVYCKIKIEDKEININAIIKRIEEIDSINFEYSIGISFLEIEELSRNTIISYIFEQQRILRNKGLI